MEDNKCFISNPSITNVTISLPEIPNVDENEIITKIV